jgi:predicted transcriptional regulator
MPDATFTFRVEADLKRRFTRRAREHDRAGSQLLRDFMRRFVEHPDSAPTYDKWFQSQVQEALNDRRAPVASHIVERDFAKRRAAARRKAAARDR